jgi:hypothetical protein
MSAPKNGHRAMSGAGKGPELPHEHRKMSPFEISIDNGRISGGCADLPYF